MDSYYQSARGYQVETSELLAAVESLYTDELRPYGRIVRKRLAERREVSGHGNADIDVKRLRSACESCSFLHVQDEEGGDWSTLLRGREAAFVDVYSPHDVYPALLWHAASAYFEGVSDASMALPGGRYSCAQALVSQNCDFLIGFTLGQICHIVQLAISQKKILGYLNGSIVPYGRSQSMIKERNAERQRPSTSGAKGKNTLAVWDDVRAGLVEIMKGLKGSGAVPLSNIKRVFRSKFHLDLSETALGHSKLSELFQDPRLQDLCTVHLQGHGYVVAPKTHPLTAQSVSAQPEQLRAPVHMALVRNQQWPQYAQPQQPGGLHNGPEYAQPLEWGQFMHLQGKAMQFPGQGMVLAGPPVALAFYGQMQQPHPCPAQTEAPHQSSLRERARCMPLCLDETVTSGPPPPQHEPGNWLSQTPSPLYQRQAQNLPRLLGNLHINREQVGKPTHTASLKQQSTPTPSLVRSPKCTNLADAVPSSPTTPTAWPVLLTPATLGNLRTSVQNTFVHMSAPPSTPLIGATSRSYSLPRNLGSKGCFSATPKNSSPEAVGISGDRCTTSSGRGQLLCRMHASHNNEMSATLGT